MIGSKVKWYIVKWVKLNNKFAFSHCKACKAGLFKNKGQHGTDPLPYPHCLDIFPAILKLFVSLNLKQSGAPPSVAP